MKSKMNLLVENQLEFEMSYDEKSIFVQDKTVAVDTFLKSGGSLDI